MLNYGTLQGRTQEGSDGPKAPPPSEIKKNLLVQIQSIVSFAVCTKKSLSQSFYNSRFYWLRCWSGTLRCIACYLFIIYNLVSGSGAGARNTDVFYNNSWVTAKLSNFVFCLGSIVDLCHYRFSEMDHKICYFLGRLTTNSFQLQGGGFAPWPPTRGYAPGPRWGHSP